MTYVQDPVNQTMSNLNQMLQPRGISVVESAQATYQLYCKTHTEPQPPLGVAVDRNTHRGQLIFSEHPILLPHETFVPLSQIELPESDSAPSATSDPEDPLTFSTDDFDPNDFMSDQFMADHFNTDSFDSEN